MSEVVKIVDTLESRLKSLFSKIENLENYTTQLKQKLTDAEMIIKNQSNEIDLLTNQYNNLKLASSFLGSDDNKKETKLKINSLIREIDYCIAQLSD
jgi:chromosome segregation ATPase